MTIITYYPSPQGVYRKLKLQPVEELAAGSCSGSQDEGWMYYNNSAHELRVCTNSSGTYGFKALGGSSGELWNYSGGNLYPADSSWNITFPASVSTVYPHKIKVDLVTGQDMWIGNSANSIVQVGWETNNALIKGVGGGSNARGLSFFTGSESSNSRRVTINATGSVGIGIDTPQGLLHVNGTAVLNGSMYANNANWTDVVFVSPWANSAGYQKTQYKKAGDLVFFRGHPTSGANSFTTYPTIFTLPVGFRPSSKLSFAANCVSCVVDKMPNVVVSTNGTVCMGSGASGAVSLDGIVFSTD